MNNQEIIDNAPEGATHYDCDEYMRHVHDGFWEYFSKADGWNETKPEEETRSLADIKRIVELESMLLSRNKEVGNWILRYDKSGTKQREIIHGQKMHIVELEAIIRGRDELINNAVSSRIAELENQWISVEDRLPDEFGDCLVYGEGFMESDYWNSIINEFAFKDDVTHWMPLPEPPKEQY